MATRRSTTRAQVPITPNFVNGNRDSSTIMKSTPSGASSPFLPTLAEGLLLAMYPSILLLGSLYATFHPALRAADYLPDAQSYDPAVAPSYFAKKGNVFNVYFVKVGWVWVTLAFGALALAQTGASGTQQQQQQQRRRVQAALRYVSVTAAWIAVTQWFFGPAIIDRCFRWTGGQCEVIFGDTPGDLARKEEMGEVREVFTHAACRATGGTWRGGHDISGHVFLLILGSATLVLEALPALLRANGISDARRVYMADGSIQDATAENGSHGVSGEQTQVTGWGWMAAMVVAGLSWWMLLMTAAYFHTWFEKLTGSLVAFAVIYFVYLLPRAMPILRGVLGLPGI